MKSQKSLPKLIQHQWLEDRKNYVEKKFSTNQLWSFSCEHEMFVIDEVTGNAASIERTSELIHAFGKTLGWNRKEDYAEILPKYSFEVGEGRYTQIKFDTEPHLIEIAFAYFWEVDEFRKHLFFIMSNLNEIAKELKLDLRTTFNLADNLVGTVEPQTKYFQGLRDFRKAIQNDKKNLSPKEANYGAFIAATQIHIGGPFVSSPNEEKYINSLYSEEPNILAYAYASKSSQPRWQFYEKVYGSFPLIGFPKMEKFTFELWFNNICKSPIYDKDLFPAYKNMETFEAKDYERLAISKRFKKIRDFQIIRPRVYGSIEFRGDPAQDDVNAILSLVMLRLGLAVYHYYNYKDVDLSASYDSWWKQVRSSTFKRDVTLIDRALIGLGLIKATDHFDIREFYQNAA